MLPAVVKPDADGWITTFPWPFPLKQGSKEYGTKRVHLSTDAFGDYALCGRSVSDSVGFSLLPRPVCPDCRRIAASKE